MVIEFVFNMFSYYCVYYGCNVEYIDCNYGGILIFYDCLFGIFVEEKEDVLVEYGIIWLVNSYNLIILILYEVIDMFWDVVWLGLFK